MTTVFELAAAILVALIAAPLVVSVAWALLSIGFGLSRWSL
jgi:hypothetical protein